MIQPYNVTAEDRAAVYAALLALNKHERVDYMPISQIAIESHLKAYVVEAVIDAFVQEGVVKKYQVMDKPKQKRYFYLIAKPLPKESEATP